MLNEQQSIVTFFERMRLRTLSHWGGLTEPYIPIPWIVLRRKDRRKIPISFLNDFEDEIDLAFRELVSKPFIDDQQVHPAEPFNETFPLLRRLQTFEILYQVRHPVE